MNINSKMDIQPLVDGMKEWGQGDRYLDPYTI